MEQFNKSAAYQALLDHYNQLKNRRIDQMFENDPNRFNSFSINENGMLLDYSKNFINNQTLSLLTALAEAAGLAEWRQKMFTGETINFTENRAVLHTALRQRTNTPVYVNGKDVIPGIRTVLAKMKEFTNAVHEARICGATGKKFTDIVNIGIGGSDLGPAMCAMALQPYSVKGMRVHFVSNVDSNQLSDILSHLEPETTLFLIASKTFTTQETMANAVSARNWFLEHDLGDGSVSKHFIALSTNTQKVIEFGINPDNMFEFWDWVGGRYSVWSAIGLSLALYIGFDNFQEFLNGAADMDKHFLEAPYKKNIPVILALLGVWYNNFFNAKTHAVIPYYQFLDKLPDYLQQLDMESNGKFITRSSEAVDYSTGAVIWGRAGTNSQHSFFQLIHQGTQLIPVDFIGICKPKHTIGNHHELLMSNFFAQTEALLKGKTINQAKEELKQSGISPEEVEALAPHKVFNGNKPTNTILLDELSPRLLGSLIAMYEHKVFVQGIIWQINPYDQWGVELGKQLAGKILPELNGDASVSTHDCSTNGLINHYKSIR